MTNPDLSKCLGTSCDKRETCLRYTQPAREKYQAWLHMETAIKDVSKCKFYWEVV